ncbi:MAG: acetoacetate--CoA ligase [Candidatus Planktophila sp.]|nr:acetoacetate--CoA ligase [Candidatus Planktophila sp.]
MQRALWAPSPTDNLEIEALQKYAQVSDFQSLHKWSIKNPELFWRYVFEDNSVIGSLGDPGVIGSGFLESKFFPSAHLNISDTLLKGSNDQIIITEISESGVKREYSRGQVRDIANKVAFGFQEIGLKEGDVVSAVVSNVSETIFFALGALKIGAIFSSTSADFGTATVLDRLEQIQPKVLLVTTNYQYNGKEIDCSQKITEIVSQLPTLKKVIAIGAQGSPYLSFGDWIATCNPSHEISIPGGFDRPGFILFSSGTTGKPKCIVHSAAGVLLKVLSEQKYHLDIRPTDNIFYYTTCGWMMWNWLFMGLGTGAGIVLFDGNPLFPNPQRLFDIAQQSELTFLGVSAKYIDSIRKLSLQPKQTHELSKLRTIASTGSPLSHEGFEYIYENISANIHLASITGGTDICGCFMLGVPNLSVYAGQIQGPALGLDVQVFTEDGQPAAVGVKGELVCRNAFPSVPLYFWDDPDKSKFRSAYFERFAAVWTHGDFVEATAQGGYIMHGRSDATLNAGGVRIGTAEIYRITEEFSEIVESLAIAQNWQGDTRVVLFVKMDDGMLLSESLIDQIKLALKQKASPRHVPALIMQAPDFPRTKSNKLVEIAVANEINKIANANVGALANPESLDWFRDLNL